MTHANYFEIEADSYYDLGLRKGELFGRYMRASVQELKRKWDWTSAVERARLYVPDTAEVLPHLIEEVHGYAEGARVCFEEAWAVLLEDELEEFAADRCTTIVTNRGSVVAHNEDWESNAKESVCVLRKRVGGLSIFELFYLNTLGGNAISVNSHGFVHAVNSLVQTDNQIGVPKNVLARWMSETSAPERAFEAMSQWQRASGYHHSLIGPNGGIWSIECSAARQILTRSNSPFVHTNHYVTRLAALEARDGIRGTHHRYRCAMEKVRDPMPIDGVRRLLDDTSEGKKKSIFNDRTIARMIVDLGCMTAYVWLRREENKGWVSYPLAIASQEQLQSRVKNQKAALGHSALNS